MATLSTCLGHLGHIEFCVQCAGEDCGNSAESPALEEPEPEPEPAPKPELARTSTRKFVLTKTAEDRVSFRVSELTVKRVVGISSPRSISYFRANLPGSVFHNLERAHFYAKARKVEQHENSLHSSESSSRVFRGLFFVLCQHLTIPAIFRRRIHCCSVLESRQSAQTLARAHGLSPGSRWAPKVKSCACPGQRASYVIITSNSP